MVHGGLQNGRHRGKTLWTQGADRLHARSAPTACPLQSGGDGDQRTRPEEVGVVVSGVVAEDSFASGSRSKIWKLTRRSVIIHFPVINLEFVIGMAARKGAYRPVVPQTRSRLAPTMPCSL